MGGWTKTPNKIYEAMPGMCEAELRVTMVVVRMTYGYQRDRVELQYEDFMIHGGLQSRASIAKGVKLMLRRGFFVKGNGRSEYVIPGSKSLLNELSENEESSLGELSEGANSSPNELSQESALLNSSLNEPGNSSLNELSQLYKEKEKGERKGEPPLPPADLALAEMVNALVDATGLDGHRFWPELSGEARELVGGGYEPAEILNFYLPPTGEPPGWNWYRHDWRGRKGDRPKLRDIWETISGARRGAPAAQDSGNGRSPANSASARIRAQLAQLENADHG